MLPPMKSFLQISVLAAALACGAAQAEKLRERWHAAVVSLSACGGAESGYVLVNAHLPDLDLPPGTVVRYKQRPTHSCVHAGDFRGRLQEKDRVVITVVDGAYRITAKR